MGCSEIVGCRATGEGIFQAAALGDTFFHTNRNTTPPFGLTIFFGDYVISSGYVFQIIVSNDAGYFGGADVVMAYANLPVVLAPAGPYCCLPFTPMFDELWLELQDPTGTALADASLPTSVDGNRFATMTFVFGGQSPDDYDVAWHIFGLLNSFYQVPEPSTLLLLGSGLAGLGGVAWRWNRRR